MADPTHLYPTPTRLLLLADVRDLNVYSDGDGTVWLDLGDEPHARVTSSIREFEQAGWCYQPDDANGWRLTQRGLDVLEGRR